MSSRNGRLLGIKLEGEIREPWVDAIREACAERGSQAKPPFLDLADVTFADAPGTQLLRDLTSEGIEIAACSRFLAELLRLEE